MGNSGIMGLVIEGGRKKQAGSGEPIVDTVV